VQNNNPKMNEQPAQTVQPVKRRGCFFYGCLTVLILAILVAVGGCLAIRSAVSSFVNKFADTKPMALPKVQLSKAETESLDQRVKAFQSAIDTNGPAQPLTLAVNEINALIDRKPELKDKFYLGIDDDQFKAQVSIPLEDLRIPFFRGLLKGRYLNGSANLKAFLQNGVLVVTLDSVEVNGKQLPAEMLAGLKNKNLVEGLMSDPNIAAVLNNLQSIQAKGGSVTITPKAKP
jgi:hypothetical protein